MTGPAITKAELFARLAEGHAAGVTVVTPNRRLAQVLRADFDAHQNGNGKTVWEDADILPLDAFVQRCYEDALYAEGGGELPLLLTGAQERALWEEAVRGSKWAGTLLDVPRTATEAMQAWRLAHDWGIARALDRADGNEDARAFAAWAKAYASRLRKDGLIDAAQLLDVPFEARKPRLLVGYAFDMVPRQVQALFERHEFLSCQPAHGAGDPGKCSFASPKAELEAAASWARARLEAGIERGKSPRIGIVVPGLEQRRREVARVFARIFGHATGSAAPFNVSLGEPLAACPLVGFALSLLEFTAGELEFEKVSRILRSPFLAGGEMEAAARALADARLRRQAPARLSLPRLIGLMDGRSGLRSVLEALFEKAGEGEGRTRSPHDWAEHCTELLAAAGFPGERTLDSAEFQARARFNEVLGEFARLSLVSPGLSRQDAFGQLRRLCAEATFQPESAAAPVQVLGLLEAAGVEFDALWVSGLTDERWPIHASPSPFLPLALQRAAGIPEASPDSALALDARITAGWAAASPATVFSWARREEDRDLLPSPLIAGMPERKPEVPEYDSHRNRIFRSGKLETLEDPNAPSLPSATVHGGTRVLADQAACPFRAYARHRLRAEALAEPAPGPDALDRGQLLHALMAGIWRELRTSASLSHDVNVTIKKAAKSAVAGLGLEGRLAKLEVERLVRLANDWLDVERGRSAFEVVKTEAKAQIRIGALELSGRLDRLDRLEDGTHAVIDYKTGARVMPKDWEGERPDDPQLPLYTVTATEPVSATAFAKLRAGDMKFLGFGSREDEIPGVAAAHDWPAMTQSWKSALEALAGEFKSGVAGVDPKRGLATCRNCDLHTLCRVHERLSALGEDEEGE
jgi:probable DNA repair protein